MGYLKRVSDDSDIKFNHDNIITSLDDEELSLIDDITNILMKYRAKLKVVGLGTFRVLIKEVDGRICFVIYANVNRIGSSSIISGVDNFIKAINVINNFDNLELPERCRERIIIRSSNYYNMFDVCIDNRNGEWDKYGKEVLSKLCQGDKLGYISPYEFGYNIKNQDSNIEIIGSYLSLSKRLYVNEVNKSEVDYKKIGTLARDSELMLKKIAESEIKFEEHINGLTDSELKYDDINELHRLSSRVDELTLLKIAVDLMLNRRTIDVLRKKKEKEDEYEPYLYAAFQDMIYHVSDDEIAEGSDIEDSDNLENCMKLYKLIQSGKKLVLSVDMENGIMKNSFRIKYKIDHEYQMLYSLIWD